MWMYSHWLVESLALDLFWVSIVVFEILCRFFLCLVWSLSGLISSSAFLQFNYSIIHILSWCITVSGNLVIILIREFYDDGNSSSCKKLIISNNKVNFLYLILFLEDPITLPWQTFLAYQCVTLSYFVCGSIILSLTVSFRLIFHTCLFSALLFLQR